MRRRQKMPAKQSVKNGRKADELSLSIANLKDKTQVTIDLNFKSST